MKVGRWSTASCDAKAAARLLWLVMRLTNLTNRAFERSDAPARSTLALSSPTFIALSCLHLAAHHVEHNGQSSSAG